MVKPTADVLKTFLLEEILASPLAEYLPAEPLRLFLDQYLGMFSSGQALPLEALGAWMEKEHNTPPGTVQLIFERLQEKGKKRGIFLLAPGQEAGEDFAAGAEALEKAAVPTFQPQDVIRVRNRNAFQQLELKKSEKLLLIFMDGKNTLADLSARTKMSVEEIQKFLQKHWDPGFFERSAAPAPASLSQAERTEDLSAQSYIRRDLPAKKSRKAKTAPLPARAASPSMVFSGRPKIIVLAIVIGLILSVSYAVFYFYKTHGRRIEVKTLELAEYASIFPFTQVNQAGEVLVGTLEPADWDQLNREEKLDQCRQFFAQAKRNGFSQVQLRAPNGDFLAVIHNEERISIIR